MPVSRRTRRSRNPTTKRVAMHDDVLQAEQMSIKEQLDMFAEDYDRQIENQMESLRKKGEELCKAINQRAKVELMKLSKDIKDKPRNEYLATATDTNTGRLYCKLHKINEKENCETKDVPSKSTCQTSVAENVQAKNEPASSTGATIASDSSHNTEHQTRKTSSRKGGKKTLKTQKMQPPRVNSCTVSKPKFKTPLASNPPVWAGDTPLFTPKFDPRLPITPATGLRRYRKNEPLFVMSVRGSPVFMSANSPIGVITLDNGMSMPVERDYVEKQNLNHDSRLKIAMMKEKLTELSASSS